MFFLDTLTSFTKEAMIPPGFLTLKFISFEVSLYGTSMANTCLWQTVLVDDSTHRDHMCSGTHFSTMQGGVAFTQWLKEIQSEENVSVGL